LAGVDLEFDDDAWRHIASIFARRNRPIAPSNRKQALRPCGSRTIFNPHGTAPGIDLVLDAETSRPVRILAFPGVPAELREMWPAVSESIRLLGGGQVFYQFTLNCFGAGESEIEAMIPAELMRRGRDPLVGITASQATISLRVSTNGPDPKECRRKIEPTIDQLRRALGDLVYGEQDEPMPWVVARRVGTSGKRLAIADLGLSGELYRSLEETGQTGRSLCGGWQLASHNLMNAMPDLGNQVPTDKEYIREVAGRVRTRLAADVGLAIGPLADENAARQVFWVAVSDGSGESMAELSCGGHPAIRRIRALKQVLNFLRLSVFR
jgi:nicotinamide-nucleotide amidase